MRIREDTPADIEDLRRIARASFDRLYAFFAVRGVRGAWPFLIRRRRREPGGFPGGAMVRRDASVGYVYFVAVDSGSRRQGIGQKLVAESMNRFAARGATRVFAAVPTENDASLGLFGSLGFERAPREALMVHTFTDLSPATAQGV